MAFLWGTAVAAHQVEGFNVASDWWDYEQRGLLKHKSGRACDFWNRWREDFDLISSMGCSAFRFSVEWARLEPEPGRFDGEALGRYVEMARDLRARQVEPVLTLHHFTNPLWFARAGGFEKRENVGCFLRFCEKVVPALAPYVRYWVTVNEPLVYAYQSYSRGIWPPFRKDFRLTLRVLGNLLEAHAGAYAVIHRHRPEAMVSIAQHVHISDPYRPGHPGDRSAAWLQDYMSNEAVIGAFRTGRFLGRRIPGMAGSWDYAGLNYYTRSLVRFAWDPGNGFGADVPLAGAGAPAGAPPASAPTPVPAVELDHWGREIYPEGLYRSLMRLGRTGRPVLVTENGLCGGPADDPADGKRIRYLRSHLEALDRARRNGVNVIGYLYWTLTDNFEWAEGYDAKFGLVAMDPEDLVRRPRPSAAEFTRLGEKYKEVG